MINQNELTRSIRFALIAGFALVASPAFAQTDAQNKEDSAENLDAIVVTGTRIQARLNSSSNFYLAQFLLSARVPTTVLTAARESICAVWVQTARWFWLTVVALPLIRLAALSIPTRFQSHWLSVLT